MSQLTKKILILEDDEGISVLMSRKLKSLGYEATTAADTNKAFELLDKQSFQAIILDYNLRENLSGIEFYKLIKAKGKYLPAILVTGLEDPKILVEALKAGIRDFIPKQENFLDDLGTALDSVMKQAKIEYEASIANSLLQANLRIEAMNKRLQVGMSEAHHRIKNSLQNISSLLNIKIRNSGNLSEEDAQKLSTHIQGLAKMHELLLEKTNEADVNQDVDIKPILTHIIETLQASVPDRVIESELTEVSLPARTTSSISVIVNELLSNAIKHGDAKIKVELKKLNDKELVLSVSNDGSQFTDELKDKSKTRNGLTIVEALALGDLGSAPKFENINSNTALVTINFNID